MAVYTHIPQTFFSVLLLSYSIGQFISATAIIEGIDNTNYKLITTQGTYILTLYESRVKQDDLPFYLALMSFLHSQNVQCPQTIIRNDGNNISYWNNRAISITGFLEGASLTHIKPTDCKKMGQFTALMHLTTPKFEYSLPNALAPHLLSPLYDRVASQLDMLMPGLSQTIAQELNHLSQWPQLSLPKGVVHADMFPDNIFFKQGQLTGVIDFYYACTDYFVYDLAIVYNAWCFDGADKSQFNPSKAQQLLQGYNAKRSLLDNEIAAFSFAARAAAIRFFLTRANDWFFQTKDAVVKPHNPLEYYEKWKFHCSAKPITDYLS